MVSVLEASNILSNHLTDFGTEEITLQKSVGRILREEIRADRDLPPYHRVAMDGIAIAFSSYESGNRVFPIQDMAPAGSPKKSLIKSGDCIEIMTGSILPDGTDTIIPYESIRIENGSATIIKEDVRKEQNIHLKGTDRAEGDILISPGKIINAVEVSILASVGMSKVLVSKLPSVIIICTGDELVEIESTPLEHQIRMSNVHQLHAALLDFHIDAAILQLNDDLKTITNELTKYISAFDVIIISGGVSAGKFDHVPSALTSLGVENHFYKVSQRPGKPFWFGTHSDGSSIFAIPGNPVSSFMCYVRYIRPWLELSLKKNIHAPHVAILSEDISFKPDLTYFLAVKLEQNEKTELIAYPMKGNGSGDFANLVDTDAFMELPKGREVFGKGEIFHIHGFR